MTNNSKKLFSKSFKNLNNLSALKGAGESNNHINSDYNKVIDLIKKEKFKDCLEKSYLLAEVYPNSPQIWNILGVSLMFNLEDDNRLSILSEAQQCFNKAIDIDPSNDEYFFNLANIHFKLDQTYEAIKYYKESLKINPDNKECQKELGKIIIKTGQIKEGSSFLKNTTGYIKFDKKPTKIKTKQSRIELDKNTLNPNFIGAWNLNDDKLCSDMLEFFENNKKLHQPGMLTGGLNRNIKDSFDLSVSPNDFSLREFSPFKKYIERLSNFYNDYADLNDPVKNLDVQVGIFNIQKYEVGGHYKGIHCERSSISSMHRVFAWMTYLNDVEEGGETVFPYQDISIKPTIGKTLIWPSEWTHSHFANPVISDKKYIVTGWIEFCL